jgi:type IV pilus assembly protein PilC
MQFEVTARDPGGVRRTFSREADTRDALMLELRAEKLLVLDVREVAETRDLPPLWHPAWLKPMTGFDVEMGLRQLASMLRSGITLLKSLATVQEQAFSPRAKRTWKQVKERILHGGSFAEALEEQPKRFGEIVVRLAEVGERSGELEHAVTRAADQMEARRNLRSTVINALMYPSLAVLMAIGVSTYLVVAVIPKIGEFLQASGAALPPVTQALMDFSDWVNANGLMVLACIGGAVAAWIAVRLNEAGRELEDVLLLKIPVVGRILRLSGTALFARSMQIMAESGVPLLDSLDTGARLMANRRFRRRVAAAHDGVMRGQSLADSLEPAVEFMPMLRRMAAVGEVSGSLPESFGETARFHEMLLAIAIKRFGVLIEPVMIAITGGIVGFVYVAFFMALFAIAGTN